MCREIPPCPITHAHLFLHHHCHPPGGDQGLLNTYFTDWATDAKRLPFIYNVSANSHYFYPVAYKRFADRIKILHFLGPSKPWHPDRTDHSDDEKRWWDVKRRSEQAEVRHSSDSISSSLSKVLLQVILKGKDSLDSSWVREEGLIMEPVVFPLLLPPLSPQFFWAVVNRVSSFLTDHVGSRIYSARMHRYRTGRPVLRHERHSCAVHCPMAGQSGANGGAGIVHRVHRARAGRTSLHRQLRAPPPGLRSRAGMPLVACE